MKGRESSYLSPEKPGHTTPVKPGRFSGFVEQATEEYQVEYGGTATNCSVQIG